MCDLKAKWMKGQHSLIQELMHNTFKLDHNVMEATKKICCVKSEGTIDQSIIIRWFKKFCWGCKNLDDQIKSGRSKIVACEAVFQAIEVNSVSSIWKA